VKDNARKAGISFRDYLSRGADPSSVQVLLEDSSSVVGTIVATSCLTLSYYYENPATDAMGSVIIGGLLSSVAVFLIRRNLKMVIEKSMPVHRLALVNRVICSDPVVENVQGIIKLYQNNIG
jgi:zinc transporter 9